MKKLLTIIFILLAFTLNAQVIDTDPSFENKIVRKYKFKKFVDQSVTKMYLSMLLFM